MGMRPSFKLLHRWAGLFIVLFLFVAGATGAVIAWDHELDKWLNPHLFQAHSGSSSASTPPAPLELAHRVEASDPRLQVGLMPMFIEHGHTLGVSLFSTVNLTPFEKKTPSPIHQPIEQVLSREQIITLAQAEASKRHGIAPPGAILGLPEPI
jgi:hypothetical protein